MYMYYSRYTNNLQESAVIKANTFHRQQSTVNTEFSLNSENDIANLLIKIKPHKAIGPDGIHPHVLYEVMAFAKPLYVLFQQSIINSVLPVPSDWTDANICALHKKGARTDPNNYRPVSLTSHVIKIFERLILHHILGYCRKHNIISCNQHGFQAGKSCLTNLLHCMNDWTTSYDKQLDKHCCSYMLMIK